MPLIYLSDGLVGIVLVLDNCRAVPEQKSTLRWHTATSFQPVLLHAEVWQVSLHIDRENIVYTKVYSTTVVSLHQKLQVSGTVNIGLVAIPANTQFIEEF